MMIEKLEKVDEFTTSVLTKKSVFNNIISFRFWELKNKIGIQKSEQKGAYMISMKNQYHFSCIA